MMRRCSASARDNAIRFVNHLGVASDAIHGDEDAEVQSPTSQLLAKPRYLTAAYGTRPVLAFNEHDEIQEVEPVPMLCVPERDVYLFAVERIHGVPLGDRDAWHTTEDIAGKVLQGLSFLCHGGTRADPVDERSHRDPAIQHL